MIPDTDLAQWRREASIIQPPGTLAAIRNERILALIADNDALRCGYENLRDQLCTASDNPQWGATTWPK